MKQFVRLPFFPILTTIVIYVFMLLWGLSGIIGDGTGYSLLCFYIFAPVTELLCGFLVGRRSVWYKWFFSLTGFLNWFIPFVVFGGRFIKAEFISLTFIAVVPAILGLFAGSFCNKFHRGKEADKMSAQDLE